MIFYKSKITVDEMEQLIISQVIADVRFLYKQIKSLHDFL